MNVAPAIAKHYPELTESQRAVVGHLDGPLLVIAGPGSGKTFSIVLRALNLLLLGKAEPKDVVLCTFTGKAAFEMRDRLAAAARKVGHAGDLSELTVSTIHGFCHRVLTRHRHRTALGHSYETLDELTQLLFIFDHFDKIIGPPEDGLFLHRWMTRWTAIEGARGYFDKITEELVDPRRLAASGDAFLEAVGSACERYEQAMLDANRVDFAHLQRLVYDMLDDPENAGAVSPRLRLRRRRRPALPAGGRIPGHQPHPGAASPEAGGKGSEPVRGGRRGSEPLPLPGRDGAQHPGVPAAGRRLRDRQADHQLPLAPGDRGALRPLDGVGRLVQPGRRLVPPRQDHRRGPEGSASRLPRGHRHLGTQPP